MCRKQCLLAFFTLAFTNVYSWEFATTKGNKLQFYNGSELEHTKTINGGELTSLAYDAAYNIILFINKRDDNASIFSYNISSDETKPLLKKKLYENITDLAFDPVTGSLFWADPDEKTIFGTSILTGSDSSTWNITDDDVPVDIAVDSCRGYIYWINSKPAIKRARLNGSDIQTLTDKNDKPVSFVIDQATQKLYWAQKAEGILFKIETIRLTDAKKEVLGEYIHFVPRTMTVSKDQLYWLNDATAYSSSKFKKNTIEVLNLPVTTKTVGMVYNYNIKDQIKNSEDCGVLKDTADRRIDSKMAIKTISDDEGVYCLHGERIIVDEKATVCKCKPGYRGKRCDEKICQNYCLNGDCIVGDGEQVSCSCPKGFMGARCEFDLCRNYCLNKGECQIDQNMEPSCKCSQEFEGSRCETRKPEPVKPVDFNCTEYAEKCPSTINDTKPHLALISENREVITDCSTDPWDPIKDPLLMALGIFSGILCVVCAVLITKVMKLTRRPRIKKRIIVNKNVTPLTSRPEQCEITIENCCNMNICETPCFEPNTRPTLNVKSAKEEKKNLIAHMEQEDY